MNQGSFNAFPINGIVRDASVRLPISGTASALGNALIRGAIHNISPFFVSADSTYTGRAKNRSPLTGYAAASPSYTTRILARSPVSGSASVSATILSQYFHTALKLFATASATLATHVVSRVVGVYSSAVDSMPILRRFARDTAVEEVSTISVVKAKAIPRMYGMLQVNGYATADGYVVGRYVRTEPVSVEASAKAAPTSRVLVKFPVTGTASASGYIGIHTTVRYQFLDFALEENTFIVPFEDNVFYVR